MSFDRRTVGTGGLRYYLCLELVLTGDSEVSPPSEEFDEVGGDLVFDGQKAGELYDEALLAASADGEEPSLVAVEGSVAYQAYPLSEGDLGEFLRGVELRGVGGSGGLDEAGHVGVGDGHRLAVGASADEAVLEGVCPVDERIKFGAGGVREEQVVDDGRLETLLAAARQARDPFQRCEDLDALLPQAEVAGELGVGTGEVAEYEPGFVPAVGPRFVLGCFRNRLLHGSDKTL